MRLRIPLAVALLATSPVAAQAHNPLCCKLFGHGAQCQTCAPDCQVHVHICKAPSACGEVSPPMRQPMQQPMQPQFTQQMLYSPILPSTVGFTMPMMPMMGTPMAYQPQFAPQYAPAPQQSAPSSAPNYAPAGNCGDCEPRVARLENGVKNLSERMDRIETILENQTAIMKKLADNDKP